MCKSLLVSFGVWIGSAATYPRYPFSLSLLLLYGPPPSASRCLRSRSSSAFHDSQGNDAGGLENVREGVDKGGANSGAAALA
ncbi:hypothetical protein PC121_g19086 [Phytophthora cactorum]|nr:hypothetical protein PC120_g18957 [Phytophthora cactorum]KAG3049119.1 hypothetical protein PC121_g19086 [Phytophthora cactorum]KAG4041037.1 hypothetical protein PC123_g23435 [Phytophthora cactorum]